MMKTENVTYKTFVLGNLFKIRRGKRLIEQDRIKGDLPYFSASIINNGLTDFIKNPLFIEKNRILVSTFGDSYFVKNKFTASDEITLLHNNYISNLSGRFIANMISSNKQKFAFGYKAFTNRVEKQKILLPVNSSNEPDYEYMETYMKQIQVKKEKQYLDYITKRVDDLKGIDKPLFLKDKVWDSFYIEDIADIISGRDIYEAERINGELPYISSTANNNGIGYFVGNKNLTLEKECLSVNRNGSVGYSFYHPYNALFSNDCRKLRPKFKSRYVGLFLSNQITQQKDKYGYGYKMGTARLKKQKIMLPINIKGEPDYEYMEQYMKYMEYKKLSTYLEFKKKEK